MNSQQDATPMPASPKPPRRKGTSNKQAVGAYLRQLRDRRGYTQAQVRDFVEALGNWPLDLSTLTRVESGQSFAGGELIVALLNVLNGSVRDVFRLQRNLDATKADGIQAANSWADKTLELDNEARRAPSLLSQIIELSDDDPEKMRQVIESLRADSRADPHLLDQVQTFLAGRRSRTS